MNHPTSRRCVEWSADAIYNKSQVGSNIAGMQQVRACKVTYSQKKMMLGLHETLRLMGSHDTGAVPPL
jgi:hypothetical protein